MSFPSEEQQVVIKHKGRPLVVIAAPGTGKTSTIVARMISLLGENPNRDVSFITFTRASRRDTDNKVAQDVGKAALEEAEFNFPRISTLHTYAKSLVHKYAHLIDRDPTFTVLINDKGEYDLVLLEVIEDLNLSVDLGSLREDIVFFRSTGSWAPDCCIPDSARNKVLNHLDVLLRFYNKFDMEGLVPASCEVLSSSVPDLPPVHLQVDEYQDLNPMDQKLITLASSTKGSQIVVVGDDAQSIYSFRHANPNGIRDLWHSDDWDKVQFTNSHRLPSHILRAAQALISEENYLGGKLDVPDYGEKKILTLQCTKSDIQVKAIAHLLKKIKGSVTDRSGKTLSYRNFMILCPTTTFVKKVALALESDYGIATRRKERATISDDHWRLLLVLRMLEFGDSLALHQWLRLQGLSEGQVRGIRRKAMKGGKSLYQYCSRLEKQKVKEVFINLEKLRESLDDLEKFRRTLKNFPNLLVEPSLFPEVGLTIDEATGEPRTVSSVIRFIHEKYGLVDPEEDAPEDDRVLVTTMYSAKGLEAEFVFVMWLNDIFIPAPGRNVAEERRVLYVAMTRAKQDVVLTFHERYDGHRYLKMQAMSSFLRNISAHLKIRRITSRDLS